MGVNITKSSNVEEYIHIGNLNAPFVKFPSIQGIKLRGSVMNAIIGLFGFTYTQQPYQGFN